MNADQLIPSLRARVRRGLLTGLSQAIAGKLGLEWLLVRVLNPVITPALDRIKSAAKSLRPPVQRMEARFLDCGSALENLSLGSDELIRNSQELIRMATSREAAEKSIAGTMAILAEPLAFLDRYGSQLQGHSASLEEGCALLDRLLSFESELKAAVAPLRVTQTMFRVEAAWLPEQERGGFLALSSQIETLHTQVRDSFGEEFAKLSEIQLSMDRLIKRVKDESGRQSQVVAQERARIAEELEKLNRQIDLNNGRQIQLTSRSQSVNGAVSRVVMALQSQDIVAQQTQHIFEGIEQILSLGLGLAIPPEESREKMTRLRAHVKLQSGQALASLRQLKETAEEVGSATGQILETVDTLNQECVFLNEFREVTASAEATIQVLLDIVDRIRGMIGGAVRLGKDSLEQLRPVNDVTTQLGACVEQFAHQMNMVALNAQIQAVQIGEGTGLEVLAAHTALIAKETSRVGKVIWESFDRLRGFLDTEVAAVSELVDTGRIQETYLDVDARSHEDRLRAMRDAILAEMHKIGVNTAAVSGFSSRVRQSAMLSGSEDQSFADMEAAFSNLGKVLADVLPRDAGEDCGRMADSHYAIYTMASERENHRNALGGEPQEGQFTEAVSQVELF